MPASQPYIGDRNTMATRAFVVATWIVFATAILLLDAPSPRGTYYLINAIGLAGLALSIVWFGIAPKWRMACAAVSILLILAYLLRWYFQIADIYTTSPQLGVNVAIERLVQVWAAVFASNKAKYGLLWALLAAYWDVLVVPVQLIVVALLSAHQRWPRQPVGAPG